MMILLSGSLLLVGEGKKMSEQVHKLSPIFSPEGNQFEVILCFLMCGLQNNSIRIIWGLIRNPEP